MNKFASLASALVLLLSINAEAQADEPGSSNANVGLGLDLELANFNSYPRFPPTNIILSIKPISALRIEPGFGFYTEKSSTDTDGEEDDYRRLRLGLGAYWVIGTKKVSPYLGIYTDYAHLTYDYDSGTAIESGYQFRIGPALGVQYYIIENFSVGGEFLILNRSENYSYETEAADDPSEYKTSGWETVSKLSFRFYF